MSESLIKIVEIIKLFSDRRLSKVTKEHTSNISKIPFNLISLRELYQSRIVEISKAAYELYEKKQFVPAFVLTRAVMETVAMFYVCYNKISQAVQVSEIEKIDDFLMQALLGSRDGTGTVKHYNAQTAVEHVGKRSKAFEELYLSLCEFAHPNWAGVYLAYGCSEEEGCLNLVAGIDPEMAEPIGIKPLLASLMLFDEIYLEMINSFPAFIRICEQNH